MNTATFLEQFEHLAEAPNGITKLRELILQLAVRGKLVPQDSGDEPATELVGRIQAEKQHLIDSKVIRRAKALPDEPPARTPYALPKGWSWARVDDVIVSVVNGFSGKQQKEPTDFPITRIETISEGSVDRTRVRYIADMPLEAREKHLLEPGDVLLSHINSGVHVGKTAVYRGGESLFHGVNLLRIRLPCPSQMAGYFHVCMNALRFAGEFQRVAQHAVGQQSINQTKLRALLISLPPLDEQERIVAKVDELMALCDDLEAKQQAKRAMKNALNRASLHALTEPNGTSLATAWLRVRDHFDDLYTVPETVADLRQTILQLAVMGRLVPQDPSDLPASELLKKIQAEKHRFIAEGTIRKPKPLPPIEKDESQTKLPSGWENVRLGAISEIGTGTTPSRAEPAYWAGGTQDWVTSAQTGDPFIEHGSELVTTRAISECRLRVYPPGTLIVALYGQGKTRGQISELRIDASVNQACAAIQYLVEARELREYTKILFWKMYHEIREQAAGGAQPNLNVGKITQIVMPLPPIAEQKHIIAKVDQLMTLCDDLEAKLQQAQTDADNLLTAIIHELVETKSEVASG